MPKLVLLGGVPGTMKSSTGVVLAAQAPATLAGTDELREAARVYDKDPFLAGTTHTRWELLGDYTPARLVDGYCRQAALMVPMVQAILTRRRTRGEDGVVEGVHLLPSLYAAEELPHVILVEHDLERLRRHLMHKFPLRPDLAERWNDGKLEQMAALQEFLERDAQESGALVLQTVDPQTNTDTILAWLARSG